ncbi:MAG: hypothetical protein RL701_1586, partial [Pseudomonadota bacterium]
MRPRRFCRHDIRHWVTPAWLVLLAACNDAGRPAMRNELPESKRWEHAPAARYPRTGAPPLAHLPRGREQLQNVCGREGADPIRGL